MCLSLFLPPHLPLFYVIMSVYHVYNCVRLSVTLMSYTCFHINSSYQLTKLCRHACQSGNTVIGTLAIFIHHTTAKTIEEERKQHITQ